MCYIFRRLRLRYDSVIDNLVISFLGILTLRLLVANALNFLTSARVLVSLLLESY